MKRTLATLAALCALAGCTRAPQRAVERLAILPFENLTGDASLDWIRAAGPAILAEQVAGYAAGPVRSLTGHHGLHFPVLPRPGLVTELVRALDAAGIAVDDIAVRPPSLDDVFASLTRPVAA